MSLEQDSERPPAITRHTILSLYEIMDIGSQHAFRGYLLDADLADQAIAIVDECLMEIIRQQGDISNGELYDKLHARLCGSEPMERSQLLSFMRFFVRSLWKAIETIARSSQDTDDTEPLIHPVRLSFARARPQKVLSYLRAIEEVSGISTINGEVLQLFVFAECTDPEISQLLEISSSRVEFRRIQALDAAEKIYNPDPNSKRVVP